MKFNCREVTRLVLAGEDRRLRWGERAVVRMHLMVCEGCTNFVQQVALMRKALQRWRGEAADAAGAVEPRDADS